MLAVSEDETDYHAPEDISWGMLKQWFKAIYSRLVSLKESMGNDTVDIAHPKNYWNHNSSCQEYIQQLKKVQRKIDSATDLARGMYFDKDSILVKRRNDRFLQFKPYDERKSTTYPRDGILSCEKEDSTRGADSTESGSVTAETLIHRDS